MHNTRIILDVDTGTDDAMAIITAMCAFRERMMALTVTHGNRPLPNTTENTLRVLELMGGGVPVYAGMPEPMVQHLTPGRLLNQRHRARSPELIHSGNKLSVHEDYLDLPPATIRPEKQHAVSFLVETLREAKEKITVIAVGPASNIGMALQMDPSIAKNIEQLIIMGGGHVWFNATSAAEANFYWDPEAAHIMLRADCPKVIFPLDATTSILFDKDDGAKIQSLGSPWAKFYGDLVISWVDRMKLLGIDNRQDAGDNFGISMHDVFCVLYLIDPSFVLEIKRQNCDVDFGGNFSDGRLVVDTRPYMPLVDDTQIAYRLDKQKVFALLMKVLAK